MGKRDLIDDARRRGWIAYLLPHEYVHSWCGKFRRPAGMCTTDFHTPQKTRLLWVYEGLAQYLGYVLAVRGGLLSQGEFVHMLGTTIRALTTTKAAAGDRSKTPLSRHICFATEVPTGIISGETKIITMRGCFSGWKSTPSFVSAPRHEQPGRFLPQVPGREHLDSQRRSV